MHPSVTTDHRPDSARNRAAFYRTRSRRPNSTQCPNLLFDPGPVADHDPDQVVGPENAVRLGAHVGYANGAYRAGIRVPVVVRQLEIDRVVQLSTASRYHREPMVGQGRSRPQNEKRGQSQ